MDVRSPELRKVFELERSMLSATRAEVRTPLCGRPRFGCGINFRASSTFGAGCGVWVLSGTFSSTGSSRRCRCIPTQRIHRFKPSRPTPLLNSPVRSTGISTHTTVSHCSRPERIWPRQGSKESAVTPIFFREPLMTGPASSMPMRICLMAAPGTTFM